MEPSISGVVTPVNNPDDRMPDQTPHKPHRINRRDVLAIALAAPAPVLAKVAEAEAGRAATKHDVSSPANHREPRYSETEHIRAYYDRGRF